VIPLLAELVHIYQGPVHVIHVNIFELHQSQCLLEFEDWVEVFVGEGFSCDEKLLSLASALLDHLVDCVAERNFVVVQSCSVDVPDTDLQAFFEQCYQRLLVLDLVSAHPQERKELFVGKEECGRSFFFGFLLFFSHDDLNDFM
jgi:hypothetical protein